MIDDYSAPVFIEKIYWIQAGVRGFRISDTELAAKLLSDKSDPQGIEKRLIDPKSLERIFKQAGFKMYLVEGEKRTELTKDNFFDKNDYDLIGALALRDTFKEFEQASTAK